MAEITTDTFALATPDTDYSTPAGVAALITAIDNTIGSSTAGGAATAIDASVTLVDGGTYLAQWEGTQNGAGTVSFGLTFNGESGANYNIYGLLLAPGASSAATGYYVSSAGRQDGAGKRFLGHAIISVIGYRISAMCVQLSPGGPTATRITMIEYSNGASRPTTVGLLADTASAIAAGTIIRVRRIK